MSPRMLNIVCAHPIMISWCLGAAVLDTAIVWVVANEVPGAAMLQRPLVILYLAIALIPATFLGFFAAIPVFLPMCAICRKINGAPFGIGDTVLILSGPRKGTVSQVYETATGQGGGKLLRVELGAKEREKFLDLFEEHSVMRVK